MKSQLLLLLLQLFLVVSVAWEWRSLVDEVKQWDRCKHSWPLSTYCSCPRHENYQKLVEYALEKELFGQPLAKEMLKKAIKSHDFGVNNRPTVIHIAGVRSRSTFANLQDNGVGKTHSTVLLANNIFSSRDKNRHPDGFLYLRGKSPSHCLPTNAGNSFQASSKDKIDESREELRQVLLNQLLYCPSSLIVFDEAEKVDRQIIRVFQEFLDSTVPIHHHKGTITL
jgi:hypothetical protein